jgi:hypothetical protein
MYRNEQEIFDLHLSQKLEVLKNKNKTSYAGAVDLQKRNAVQPSEKSKQAK